MDKKKILVIIPDRLVKSTGGMGGNFSHVTEMLSKEFDFYIAGFPLEDTVVPSWIKGYLEVFNPLPRVGFGPVATMQAQVSYLAAAIRFPRPDVVYAYDWSVYLAAIETARLFDVPLVVRMCLSPTLLAGVDYTFGLNRSIASDHALHDAFCQMEAKGLHESDCIVQNSEGYAEYFDQVKEFQDKTKIVPNSIDLSAWQKKKFEKYPLPGKNKKKVVYLGRFSEVKGILPLCEARVPDGIDLIFIGPKTSGEGRCIEAIERRVASSDNVHYIGPLYGDDKIRALRSADAVIVPSLLEAFGGAALEGLAAECIVLSSRMGGLKDFTTEATSIFCGTTPESIEVAFEKLLAQKRGVAAKMRAAGLEMCKKYSIENNASKLAEVFRTVHKRNCNCC